MGGVSGTSAVVLPHGLVVSSPLGQGRAGGESAREQKPPPEDPNCFNVEQSSL